MAGTPLSSEIYTAPEFDTALPPLGLLTINRLWLYISRVILRCVFEDSYANSDSFSTLAPEFVNE